MKSLAIAAVLALISGLAAAQETPVNNYSGAPWQKPENGVQVENAAIGSGDPAATAPVGTTTATPVADGVYHVPSYMPGFPTSARIDPRVVQVPCTRAGGAVVCQGFNVNTEVTGRGEYLLIQPIVAPAPKVEKQVVPQPVLPVERRRVKE